MKDGRITQAGKHNDILKSGTDFMELVGAHEKALLALDSTVAGPVSGCISKEAGNLACTNGVVQNQEDKDVQNGKADDLIGSNGQLIREEERERKVKLGYQSIGNISLWHMEELLCHLYCWHKFSFRSFKLEAIVGWPGQLLSHKT